jgi:hypothetical protein
LPEKFAAGWQAAKRLIVKGRVGVHNIDNCGGWRDKNRVRE